MHNVLSQSTIVPVEIWLRVASLTSRDDRRSLLRVSRILHDAVLPTLFDKITLQFGLWESMRPANIPEDTDMLELAAATARRTREIISCVANDGAFARIVRQIYVMSYTFKEVIGDNIEREELLAVIRAVPHLQCFHWMGNFPHLPLSVAQALSEYCPHLRELRIPATHKTTSVPHSLNLRRLDTLIVVCQLDIDNVHGYWPDRIAQCRPELLHLINSNHRLNRLTIYGDLLTNISHPVFENLRELEIWGPHDEHINKLDYLLPRASQLERLSLVEITHCQDIIPILERHTQAFTQLKALKVMSIDPVHSEDCMFSLTTFIAAQKQLCWLDIDMPGLQRVHLLKLLEGISEVRNLKVLGIDCRSIFDLEDVETMAHFLPPTLVALHLQLSWENIPFTSAELKDLLDSLAEMTPLYLLHVQTMYATNLDMVEELAFALASVMVIGLGKNFWDVDRSDVNPAIKPWTLKEVALRSVATIGEAGEWLLRFHNLLEGLEES